MKPLLSAMVTALILFSAQSFAEQTTQPVVTSCGNVVVVPHHRNNHHLILTT